MAAESSDLAIEIEVLEGESSLMSVTLSVDEQ
jgi:hypothetical protein